MGGGFTDWNVQALQLAVDRVSAQLAEDATEVFVTMDQASACCNRSKRTLERLLQDGKIPEPDIPGGGGRAHRWRWSALRPALEEQVGRRLPQRFPSGRVTD